MQTSSLLFSLRHLSAITARCLGGTETEKGCITILDRTAEVEYARQVSGLSQGSAPNLHASMNLPQPPPSHNVGTADEMVLEGQVRLPAVTSFQEFSSSDDGPCPP